VLDDEPVQDVLDLRQATRFPIVKTMSVTLEWITSVVNHLLNAPEQERSWWPLTK